MACRPRPLHACMYARMFVCKEIYLAYASIYHVCYLYNRPMQYAYVYYCMGACVYITLRVYVYSLCMHVAYHVCMYLCMFAHHIK